MTLSVILTLILQYRHSMKIVEHTWGTVLNMNLPIVLAKPAENSTQDQKIQNLVNERRNLLMQGVINTGQELPLRTVW